MVFRIKIQYLCRAAHGGTVRWYASMKKAAGVSGGFFASTTQTSIKFQVCLQQQVASHFVDARGGREARYRAAAAADMLGIAFVEQVVDASCDLRSLADAIGAVHRKHAKTTRAADVLTDDVALIGIKASLLRNQTQQRTDCPDLVVISQAKAPFQRRQLCQ